MSTQWSDTWYPQTIADLTAVRGDGPTGRDGNPLPGLLAFDTIAVVAAITTPLIAAMNDWNKVANKVTDAKAIAWASVDLEDGRLSPNVGYGDEGPNSRVLLGEASGSIFGSYIDAATYLQMQGLTDRPWVRGVSTDQESAEIVGTYEPYAIAGSAMGTTNNLLGMQNWRLVIQAYQRIANASAACIANAVPFMDGPCDGESLQELVDAMAVFCAMMDNFAYNPPQTSWQTIMGKVKDKLSESLNDLSEAAGKTVAELANQVGKTAAGITKGFFEEASLMSIAVVGVAVYIAVR